MNTPNTARLVVHRDALPLSSRAFATHNLHETSKLQLPKNGLTGLGDATGGARGRSTCKHKRLHVHVGRDAFEVAPTISLLQFKGERGIPDIAHPQASRLLSLCAVSEHVLSRSVALDQQIRQSDAPLSHVGNHSRVR